MKFEVFYNAAQSGCDTFLSSGHVIYFAHNIGNGVHGFLYFRAVISRFLIGFCNILNCLADFCHGIPDQGDLNSDVICLFSEGVGILAVFPTYINEFFIIRCNGFFQEGKKFVGTVRQGGKGFLYTIDGSLNLVDGTTGLGGQFADLGSNNGKSTTVFSRTCGFDAGV